MPSELLAKVATDEAVPRRDARAPLGCLDGDAEVLRIVVALENHENTLDILPRMPSEGVRGICGFSTADVVVGTGGTGGGGKLTAGRSPERPLVG